MIQQQNLFFLLPSVSATPQTCSHVENTLTSPVTNKSMFEWLSSGVPPGCLWTTVDSRIRGNKQLGTPTWAATGLARSGGIRLAPSNMPFCVFITSFVWFRRQNSDSRRRWWPFLWIYESPASPKGQMVPLHKGGELQHICEHLKAKKNNQLRTHKIRKGLVLTHTQQIIRHRIGQVCLSKTIWTPPPALQLAPSCPH